jgi:tight adherence protein B
MIRLIAALAVGSGLALVVTALLVRIRERDRDLLALLELAPNDDDDTATAGRGLLVETGVDMAQRALVELSLLARVSEALERGRVPMRPGEFVLAAAATGVAGGLLAGLFTGQLLVGVLTAMLMVFAVWRLLLLRVARRRKAFDAQFPEAISLIASSLQAGHTFLRSIQMMIEESEPPISDEFERVVAETRLGDPLVDALERMADRLQSRDLTWVVQAIRIQQEVGGKLADLLFTLSDFMRAREEIRREVRVLTAEGRMSALVLGGLPIGTFLLLQSASPSYMTPLRHGWGLASLIGAAISVAFGVIIINRMVRIEV